MQLIELDYELNQSEGVNFNEIPNAPLSRPPCNNTCMMFGIINVCLTLKRRIFIDF